MHISSIIEQIARAKQRELARAAALEKRLPELRAIRKRNGVGRPPYGFDRDSMIDRPWSRVMQARNVNAMAAKARCYQ